MPQRKLYVVTGIKPNMPQHKAFYAIQGSHKQSDMNDLARMLTIAIANQQYEFVWQYDSEAMEGTRYFVRETVEITD
jgi:hypothetical protein